MRARFRDERLEVRRARVRTIDSMTHVDGSLLTARRDID